MLGGDQGCIFIGTLQGESQFQVWYAVGEVLLQLL